MLNIPEEIKETVGRGESLFNALWYVNGTYDESDINIVETGTTRGNLGGGPLGDGWSTILWAWYVTTHGGNVFTIDKDQRCLDECFRLTKEFTNVHYINSNSINYLSKFNDTIHLLYLDSADDPLNMYTEFTTAEPKLDKEAYILLDDVGPNFIRGKGQILGPNLLAHKDFELVYHDSAPTTNQALFRKKLNV
jgi:hypothetical protein